MFLIAIFLFINILMMRHAIIIPIIIYRYLRLWLITKKYDSIETISIDHISAKILAILIIWIFFRHLVSWTSFFSYDTRLITYSVYQFMYELDIRSEV